MTVFGLSPRSIFFGRNVVDEDPVFDPLWFYVIAEIKKYQDEFPDAIIEDVEFSKNDDGEYIMTIIAKHPKVKELP